MPAVAQVLLDLGRRNRRLAEHLGDDRGTDPEQPRSPHEEIRDFYYRRRNYLHDIDLAAEELAQEIGIRPGEVVRALAARLADRHGVRLTGEIGDCLHQYDERTRTLRLSTRLRPGQRAFRMATSSPCSNTATTSTAGPPRTSRPVPRPTASPASASPTTSRRP
ncbi:hypothetical protein GCM10010339_58830 [Streptomyces alanosinicus]|uniref:Uncharacterized protein n=1 Tax=Streptomyces alanosinicus TaxID=68171 RepID=A0A918YMT2_9ACTN|nr:hypothetical protein GCM10010339_58830 [Streptomyces alanosinicus]